MRDEKLLTTRNMVLIAMFGALACALMFFDFPIPFLAPGFYEMDFSEVPVLVGTFALGPAAGVLIEALKILLKLALKGTSTGFVGDFANFCFGCALVVPAGLVYHYNRTKKGAILGLVVGTAVMVVVGIAGNAKVMLPFYSTMMPMETILAAGAAIHPAVDNEWTFALLCVAPFNLVKGIMVSIVTVLVYKRISIFIHSVGEPKLAGKKKNAGV